MASQIIELTAELPELNPSAALPVPSRFGRYRLTRLLAVGGMAQVYLAKAFGAEGFVKPLVIKRLDPRLAQNDFFTALFVNEAKLLVTLSHGNIVSVFDFGRVGDDLFMAMEYVDGLPLSRLLKQLGLRDQAIEPPLAAHVILEVCKGLCYAHRKTDARGCAAGIVHRDIKPSNILISREGEVKIVDFGVAKLVGRLEQHKPLAGTAAYMSPEQAGRRPVDARADIFSAGLVLHEMLGGTRIYEASTLAKVLNLAREARVPELPPEAPGALCAVVRRACATEPDDRYATAAEMQRVLSAYLLDPRLDEPGSTARPPAIQLGELVRQLAPPAEQAVSAEDDEPLGEHAMADEDGSVSWLSEGDEAIDLELMRGAAETFHSEFMTRALALSEDHASRRRGRRLALVAGLAALAIVAVGVMLIWSGAKDGEPREAQERISVFDARPRKTSQAARSSQLAAKVRSRDARIADATEAASRPVTAVSPGADAATPGHHPVHRRAVPRYGYLNVNAVPWAYVQIDGRRMRRTTPLLRLRLRAGRHTLELTNPARGLRREVVVHIRPDKTTWKVVRLAKDKGASND